MGFTVVIAAFIFAESGPRRAHAGCAVAVTRICAYIALIRDIPDGEHCIADARLYRSIAGNKLVKRFKCCAKRYVILIISAVEY